VAREEKRGLAAAGGARGRAGVEAEIAESCRQAEKVVAEGEVQREAGRRWRKSRSLLVGSRTAAAS
jgi:hypothetical protein